MDHIIIILVDNYDNLLLVFLLQISAATDNDSSLASFRSLRTLRALRPLRAISRWEGMKVNNSSTRKLTIQFSLGAKHYNKGDFHSNKNSRTFEKGKGNFFRNFHP